MIRAALILALVAACGGRSASPADAATDATPPIDTPVAVVDTSPGDACAVFGAPGVCLPVSSCGALGDHTAYPGYCPGPSEIQCCIVTPNVANNPPIPSGYRLMMQSEVTPAMTTWAVAILHDPVTYPMFATTTMTFGAVTVLARVEWHPPDFNNGVVHRGVTLYVPL